MPRASPLPRARPRRFPGAFPPARIVEMDEVVGATARRAGRGAPSSSPRAFPITCAPTSIRPRHRSSTARCSTIGRSMQAISAIHGRPAYREVDRRLVYIDPHPAPPVSPRRQQGPGLLCDLARRAVGYPELAAGDRRTRPRGRVQRPGAAAARDHRQRAARRSASW